MQDMKILRCFMTFHIPCEVDNSREPGILPDMIEPVSKAMNGKPCFQILCIQVPKMPW